MLAFMGTYEWIAVVGIVVLLFGAKKLPELGRSLGESIKEFKKSSHGILDDDEKKPAEPAKDEK